MGTAVLLREESQALDADEKHVLDGCTEKLSDAARLIFFGFKCSSRRTAAKSISFNGRDLEKTVSGSNSFKGSKRERALLRSISLKGSYAQTNSLESTSFRGKDLPSFPKRSKGFRPADSETASIRSNSSKEMAFENSSMRSDSFKEDAAALKLQKVYKSYRTRRNLADCAVVVEELWWQALDFVTLKQNTVSFFDIKKPETAVSRWSRARIKAAKVGKGLSKDGKAQKLAFQHWLEAIDPRHRYGHNLHFYYEAWFKSNTVQPFFYWLYVGDGRDLNLERCSRMKLQQQCIKYLGPKEREQYEVIGKDGKLVYKNDDQLVDTTKGSKGSKWIFVLSTSKKLYVGQKKKGTFQHSTFLAGGATSAAGRLVVDDGVLKSIWPYSGHYLPTEENFREFIKFLEEISINLTNVQKSPAEEDEQSLQLGKNLMIGSEPNSEAERDEQHLVEKLEKIDSHKDFTSTNTVLEETAVSTPFWTNIESNETGEICSRFSPRQRVGSCEEAFPSETDKGIPLNHDLVIEERVNNSEEAHKTAGFQGNKEQEFYKRSLSEKNLEDARTEVPHKSLLHRLQSRKSLQSYQLSKQPSFKWSTGAGPRIACVADCPSEFRVMALEKVNLSPRFRSSNSPREFLDLSRQPLSPRFL